MTETEALIALNMIPGLGPVLTRRLLEAFGLPQSVLRARTADLQAVKGVGPELAAAIVHWEERIDLAAELKRIEEFGAKIVTAADPLYPALLKEIHNPPLLLYVWGALAESDRHAISIVGSRRTSHYGLECAKKLSYQLAYAGLTIVSGLARGIDSAAHQGALAAKGRTIAVIGSGLMDLYPPENQALAEKIAENGAVVSEFPMTFPPSKETFPQRNRIVSGWSDGVLVVEAGLKSGALITAGQAAEQGRSVYAVPGPIDRPTHSGGPNRLIQQGAKLVMGAEDILEDLQILLPEKLPLEPTPARAVKLEGDEKTVYEAIGDRETPLDDVIEKSGLPPALVASTLLTLEFRKLVKQLPGRHFVKLL